MKPITTLLLLITLCSPCFSSETCTAGESPFTAEYSETIGAKTILQANKIESVFAANFLLTDEKMGFFQEHLKELDTILQKKKETIQAEWEHRKQTAKERTELLNSINERIIEICNKNPSNSFLKTVQLTFSKSLILTDKEELLLKDFSDYMSLHPSKIEESSPLELLKKIDHVIALAEFKKDSIIADYKPEKLPRYIEVPMLMYLIDKSTLKEMFSLAHQFNDDYFLSALMIYEKTLPHKYAKSINRHLVFLKLLTDDEQTLSAEEAQIKAELQNITSVLKKYENSINTEKSRQLLFGNS